MEQKSQKECLLSAVLIAIYVYLMNYNSCPSGHLSVQHLQIPLIIVQSALCPLDHWRHSTVQVVPGPSLSCEVWPQTCNWKKTDNNWWEPFYLWKKTTLVQTWMSSIRTTHSDEAFDQRDKGQMGDWSFGQETLSKRYIIYETWTQ